MEDRIEVYRDGDEYDDDYRPWKFCRDLQIFRDDIVTTNHTDSYYEGMLLIYTDAFEDFFNTISDLRQMSCLDDYLRGIAYNARCRIKEST